MRTCRDGGLWKCIVVNTNLQAQLSDLYASKPEKRVYVCAVNLELGSIADKALAIVSESHIRWGDAVTLNSQNRQSKYANISA